LHKGIKLTTSKAKTKKKRMPPKKYVSILKKIDLKEIYLESCSSEIRREHFKLKENLEVKIRDNASYEQIKNKLKIKHKYFLTAKRPKAGKDFSLKASATFCLIFSTQEPIEKDFFDIFREINLMLNTWPYFREFVQSMTQRMNVPPLTLPFVKRS
jgi:preprotein translocase subunit SecB